MAEFLTPKRNSFINRTVGVVSTNTGAAQVGRAIEQAGARATQMFYEEAVKEQKKVGVETVRKMPSVMTRNDQGELEFETLPENLSDVARETATPYLLKRYANQLDRQTSEHIGMLSAETKDYEEFNSKVKTYLEATEKQLSADNVGRDLIGMFRDSASKLSAQYGIKKYQEQIKEEEANAIEDSLYLVDRFTNDMASMIRTGGLDESAQLNKQEALNELELLRGRIPKRTFDAYKARLVVAEKTGIITRTTRGMSSLELNQVERGIGDQTFDGLPKDLKEKLEKAGINNRFFDGMTEANINEVKQDIASRASNQATIETDLAKDTADTNYQQQSQLGVAPNTPKARDAINGLFTGYNEPAKWMTNPDLINNPKELNKLRRSNIMPSNLVQALKLIENPTTLRPNNVVLLNNYRKQFQFVGGQKKDIPISKDLQAKFEIFDKFMQFYGVNGAEQAFNMTFAEGAATSEERAFAIQKKFGNVDVKAQSLIARKIMELSIENDFVADSAPLLKTLYGQILSNKNVSVDMADEIITNLYSQMYVKSEYTYSHNVGSKIDSRFAPEKYLKGDKLNEFVTGADAKLSMAGSKLKLGENAFLLPDPKSGDNGALYYAVNDAGVLIVDKNNQPIQFRTNNILKSVLQSRLRLQQKINRATKTQILKENPVLDKDSKLPPSFGVDIKKQM